MYLSRGALALANQVHRNWDLNFQRLLELVGHGLRRHKFRPSSAVQLVCDNSRVHLPLLADSGIDNSEIDYTSFLSGVEFCGGDFSFAALNTERIAAICSSVSLSYKVSIA